MTWTFEKAQEVHPTQSQLSCFFAPPPTKGQAGRPARVETRGRPARESIATPPQRPLPAAAETPAADAPSAAKTPAAPAKQTRTNWALVEHGVRMKQAVHDWDGKTGVYLELSEEDRTLAKFAARVEIPYETLRKYVAAEPEKRRELGRSVGKPSNLTPDLQEFTVDVLRRRDRANDGMNRQAGIDMVQDLKPELRRDQAARAFDKVRKDNKEALTGIVKAQASTTKRSAITVSQQWRWHYTIEGAFDLLRKLNTGVTPDGKTFGEVMPHFVIGGDETGLQASKGDVSIIGDKAKPKHELCTSDSRLSITMYRSGSAAGANGPTGFLPPGEAV
jgi:hypothetical protein